jgi:hypothetical protein
MDCDSWVRYCLSLLRVNSGIAAKSIFARPHEAIGLALLGTVRTPEKRCELEPDETTKAKFFCYRGNEVGHNIVA